MSSFEELEIAIPQNIKWDILVLDDVKSPEKRSIISGPFGSNISSKYFTKEGIPVIRGNNLSNNLGVKFRDIGFVFISPEKANELNSWAIKEDLLFTAAGTIGQVGILTGKEKFEGYIISNKQLRVRLNKNIINPFYAYYWFASPALVDIIIQRDTGSTIPLINLGVLKSLPILLPPLQVQERIAEVLSSLDDKIDLLQRQNKTLEEMAETLFRQWFVEEAVDSWEVKPLGAIVSIKRGGSPRPIQDFLSETGLRWLKISDATKESAPYIFEIKEHIKVEGLNKTTFLKAGNLVLSNSATPGIPKILQVDTCIHDGWLHFPKSYFSNEFLYLFFNHIKPELLQQGNGSIFTNLKTDILKEFPIAVPDIETLKAFDGQIKIFFHKILQNQIQIRSLTAIRDTLLPKLMSGLVTVNEIA